jgi:hypothetical protein
MSRLLQALRGVLACGRFHAGRHGRASARSAHQRAALEVRQHCPQHRVPSIRRRDLAAGLAHDQAQPGGGDGCTRGCREAVRGTRARHLPAHQPIHQLGAPAAPPVRGAPSRSAERGHDGGLVLKHTEADPRRPFRQASERESIGKFCSGKVNGCGACV